MLLLFMAFGLGLVCPISPGTVEWRTRADDPTRVYLFVDGRQRGGYDWANDEWRDFDGQEWGPPRSFRRLLPESSTTNFGVIRERLAKKERFWIESQDFLESRTAAPESLVPDDSNCLRLTIIGAAEDRQRVLDDLRNHSDLANACRGMLVQDYAPKDWAVADAGFVTTGTPTIYLQAPDGRVLHRQDEYHGAERLASALRRAQADYNPADDPNFDRRFRLLDPATWPRTVWCLLGILACLWLFRRKP